MLKYWISMKIQIENSHPLTRIENNEKYIEIMKYSLIILIKIYKKN